MTIRVQKYGGTSVGSAERIIHVAKRIKKNLEEFQKIVVVVSAMGDTTDELIALASAITKTPSAREMDMLLSTGEQVSIALLSLALHEEGIRAISMTGGMSGIATTAHHRKAKILNIDAGKIEEALKTNQVVIVAGFQGVSEDGSITTLGRGGSDTTAVALAAALGADCCEIYTDVSGVYSSDPRDVPLAKQLSTIDYDEMLEMAKLGAGVLHPRSIEIGRKYGIPIVVRSTFDEGPGTIVKEISQMEKVEVRGVALDDHIARISVTQVPDRPGIAFELFSALANKAVPVDMIIQNLNHADQNDISFTIAEDDLHDALAVCHDFQIHHAPEAEILYKLNTAKLSIIGTGICGHTEVASKLFKTLYEAKVNIEMISTSEIRISCLIDGEQAKMVAARVHTAFDLDQIAEDSNPLSNVAFDANKLKESWVAES